MQARQGKSPLKSFTLFVILSASKSFKIRTVQDFTIYSIDELSGHLELLVSSISCVCIESYSNNQCVCLGMALSTHVLVAVGVAMPQSWQTCWWEYCSMPITIWTCIVLALVCIKGACLFVCRYIKRWKSNLFKTPYVVMTRLKLDWSLYENWKMPYQLVKSDSLVYLLLYNARRCNSTRYNAYCTIDVVRRDLYRHSSEGRNSWV